MTGYWKFLAPGRVSPFVRYVWPEPGQWLEVGTIEACRSGLHACRPADLPYWLLDELWQVELSGTVRETASKVVATRARLVAPVTAWDERARAEFGEACVRRTVGFAVDELRDIGLDRAAGTLLARFEDGTPGEAFVEVANDLAERAGAAGHDGAAWLCGYAGDAVATLAAEPLVAVAFVAARAAGQRAAVPEPVEAERAWQADWLTRRLALMAG